MHGTAGQGPALLVSRAPLDRATIVGACVELVEELGVDGLTMRRLGDRLGVDPTAVYRHFRDKDELLRAVGDHAHGEVLGGLSTDLSSGPWRAVVRELCVRLRAAHLARPDLAALVRTGPPLQEHELRLTETLLRELRRARLGDDEIVLAYHSLIELTVGAAAIDAPMSTLPPRERAGAYRGWRQAYASLDADRFPESVRLAASLYPADADTRFEHALDRLLDGIAPRSRRIAPARAARRDP